MTKSPSSPFLPFTTALQSLHSPLWTEIDTICATAPFPTTPPVSSRLTSASYPTQLNSALQSLQPLFLPSAPLDQAISAIDDATLHLSTIETTLDDVIANLQSHATQLDGTASQYTRLCERLDTLTHVHGHVADFAEQVQLPSQLVTTLLRAHTHSKQFRCAVGVFMSKLAFVRKEVGTGSVAGADVLKLLEKLRVDVVGRLMVRLEHSLRLLSEPTSTFEIMRDALLYKRGYLLEFVAEMGDKGDVEGVLRQYVYIASKAAEERIGVYCEALATWAAIERAPGSLFDFASLARGTAGMFSAVFTEILPASSVAVDVTEEGRVDEGNIRAESEGGEERLGVSLGEQMEAVVLRWMDAFKVAGEPCLTVADILTRRRDSVAGVEEVCRNAIVLYLDSIEREKTFLQGTFGESSGLFLEDVFRECEKPLLSTIESKVDDALECHGDLLGILICLILNRWHRSRVVPMETQDARISFLVQVEKLLQTRLLAGFDSRLEKLPELPIVSPRSAPAEIHHASSVATLTALVANMLVVVIQAAKDVQAGDIFETIQRRLLTFAKHVVKTIEMSGHNLEDQASRHKSNLRGTAVVLSVLEIPADLVRDDGAMHRLREPLVALYGSACNEYGAYVVQRSVVELSKAEDAIKSQRFEEAKVELTQLQNQLRSKIQSIADGYSFLCDKNNISESIQRVAVEAALRIFAERNDHLTRLVQEHMPSDSHLVVTRSALVHATKENS